MVSRVPLIHGPLWEAWTLRFQIQLPEGLLILGKILAQHIPKRFGLLWAQKNSLVIANGHLFGAVAASQAEHELKIPYANANLHAVGIGLTVIVALDKIHLRLLRSCLTHATSLRR